MTIRFNEKIDRFYDDISGKFVTNISGMLSAVGRRELKRSERSGKREKFRRSLRSRLSKRRKVVRSRSKLPPPTTPAEHLKFEFESRQGDIDLYLDEFMLRNIELMDEEVIY